MPAWLPHSKPSMAEASRPARSWRGRLAGALAIPALAPNDLLRDVAYRRLWTSIVISSFGGQVTMLALPLTAALLLHASPTQMGLLTAMELLPFVCFSLPTGVWLDRVEKLPVYVAGELAIGVVVASVPLAWWLGWLSIRWLYVCAFVIGTVYTTAGSAAQIVLTQVVARERLVEAHAKNALATSGAEVAGPGLAGAIIKLVGAPLALLVDAVLVSISAAILRGLKLDEGKRAGAEPRPAAAPFWAELKAGVRFVARERLLVSLAVAVGCWQACHQCAMVVQILFATRTLGLTEHAIGLSYTAMGAGTIVASVFGQRFSRRFGPGPCLILGFASCGSGWLLLSIAPANAWGVAAFTATLTMFSTGATLIFMNFLAMRQAATPEPLLGRMTSTMRWLILVPAGPGALLGGWLGDRFGLRTSLAVAGCGSLLLALVTIRVGIIRRVRALPKAGEADVRDAALAVGEAEATAALP